jgi:hypothetical protein
MCELDREKIFGESARAEYLWCLHCERAYKYGKFRLLGGLQMCPYEGCAGDTVLDACPWDEIRAEHEDYPDVPEWGVYYPMY